jgi:glycosyltransferase involved in cell wall biosynthesis
MSDDINRRYGFKKQTDVTNAANITLFSTPVNKTTPFTQRRYAIYTGNIGEVNNSGWLLEAARELKRQSREDIIILLIGEGQLSEKLERLAAEENLSNFVRLGLMPKEDLVAYVQQSMVSLVPLKGERVLNTSSPNKFFESLAAGVPVVQNTTGWMREFLETNKAGFTVAPDDARGLANLLVRLSADDEMLRDMGRRGKELARKYFDKDVLSAKMLEVLNNVHNSD